MEKRGVVSSVLIALVIGLGIGSVVLPMRAPANTVTYTHTVTNYTNQNSASVVEYYMVCVATQVYGGTISGQTMTFVPFYTASTTFVSVTTSSATPGHVPTAPSGANNCTYVSTVP
jgi:Na+-driven multidrug efflux pump